MRIGVLEGVSGGIHVQTDRHTDRQTSQHNNMSGSFRRQGKTKNESVSGGCVRLRDESAGRAAMSVVLCRFSFSLFVRCEEDL